MTSRSSCLPRTSSWACTTCWPGSLGAGADLSVSLSASPDPVVGQQLLTYTIAVANAGPEAASAVTVSVPLPAGVALDTAAGTGWICGETGGAVVCTRPSLAVGPAPAITLSVFAPPAAGTLTNTVTVGAEEADPVPGNNTDTETTTVVAAPFVSLGTRSKSVLADSGGSRPAPMSPTPSHSPTRGPVPRPTTPVTNSWTRFIYDSATSTEIILQTEKFLGAV